jgi:hypothetical protein
MSTTEAALWHDFWASVGNEDWLAAAHLLEASPRVRGYFARFLGEELTPRFDTAGNEAGTPFSEVLLDWKAAADRIDLEGFSSTETRLARLVAALTTEQPFPIEDLTRMGSWSLHVWQALVEWGTDGRATLQVRS